MKTIQFEKKGLKFVFTNFNLNEHGDLAFAYKVLIHHENSRDPEGFFYNAKLKDNVVYFYGFKYNGKEVKGVSLPDEIANEINQINDKLKSVRDKQNESIIEQLTSGKLPIKFNTVGCDYQHYQATITIETEADRYELMETATRNYLSQHLTSDIYLGSTICDFLGKIANTNLRRKEELPENAFDCSHDPEDGYKDFIISTWHISLPNLLAKYIEEQKIKAEKEAQQEAKANTEAENELMIFGTEILSSVNFKFLHSLGARQQDDKIQVYTTGHSNLIPNAKTTYDIKDHLKALGCSWNKDEKTWDLPASESNWEKIVAVLKEFDTKVDPRSLGLSQCWECGCWVKHVDSDGYCGC